MPFTHPWATGSSQASGTVVTQGLCRCGAGPAVWVWLALWAGLAVWEGPDMSCSVIPGALEGDTLLSRD